MKVHRGWWVDSLSGVGNVGRGFDVVMYCFKLFGAILCCLLGGLFGMLVGEYFFKRDGGS